MGDDPWADGNDPWSSSKASPAQQSQPRTADASLAQQSQARTADASPAQQSQARTADASPAQQSQARTADDPWANGNDPWSQQGPGQGPRPAARQAQPPRGGMAKGGGKGGKNIKQHVQMGNWYAEVVPGPSSDVGSSCETVSSAGRGKHLTKPAFQGETDFTSSADPGSNSGSSSSGAGRGKHLVTPSFQSATEFGNPSIPQNFASAGYCSVDSQGPPMPSFASASTGLSAESVTGSGLETSPQKSAAQRAGREPAQAAGRKRWDRSSSVAAAELEPLTEVQEALCRKWVDRQNENGIHKVFNSVEVLSRADLRPASREDESCTNRSREEPLLLLDLRDDLAYVCCHCRPACERAWVKSDSLLPSPAYEFPVRVFVKRGQRIGLSFAIVENTKHQVGGLLVYHVEANSVLADWNERCRQRFPRDQLLPGDLIVRVQDACTPASPSQALQALKELSSPQMLKLQVLRAAAALLFRPDEALTSQILSRPDKASQHPSASFQQEAASNANWTSNESEDWALQHQQLQQRLEQEKVAKEREDQRLFDNFQ
eukprot:TRINITY_DN10541_c0_g1_i1.p1 TRINITY_DN10541_c0_g1~~TRINITY_DN10541_c0_g1_i1.p1  ORF type:complete len:547 (+),score=114.90 TRINITY_DN10541_c0_g1_i1:37-1677(+)